MRRICDFGMAKAVAGGTSFFCREKRERTVFRAGRQIASEIFLTKRSKAL